MKKIALITGATAGIGEATARRLASDYSLIICGRRQDRLDQLKSELSVHTDIHTLSFDVRDREAVFSSIDSLPENWKNIDVLINNAGNAHGLAPVHEGSLDDWDAMIDINAKGLLYVSKAVLPGMVERKSGFVVNISSIAGKEVYPNGNVYCASKYAVDAITQGMRLDMNPHGIRVCSINPGLVETEFSLVRFKGDEERAKKVYADITALTGDDVADAVEYVISRPAHVMVGDLTMFPTDQASATVVNRR
ncbi:MAG: SDR family NAD(P)-dependent oxidoreductase [Bacteroidota bacterium]